MHTLVDVPEQPLLKRVGHGLRSKNPCNERIGALDSYAATCNHECPVRTEARNVDALLGTVTCT